MRGERPLAEADLAPPVTIVLGAEREGLPDELLAECDAVATIPMPGEAESLNVAAAGAIALYELSARSLTPSDTPRRGVQRAPSSSSCALDG